MHEGPQASGMASVSLVLLRTCTVACTWAWDNLLNRPHRRTDRVEKTLATLQSIERSASDQHDHVRFAKARTTVPRTLGKVAASLFSYLSRVSRLKPLADRLGICTRSCCTCVCRPHFPCGSTHKSMPYSGEVSRSGHISASRPPAASPLLDQHSHGYCCSSRQAPASQCSAVALSRTAHEVIAEESRIQLRASHTHTHTHWETGCTSSSHASL